MKLTRDLPCEARLCGDDCPVIVDETTTENF